MTIRDMIHSIGDIARRECIRIASKPIYLFTMVIAPVISLVFFLSLMQNGLPTNLPIAVVDRDNSSTSRTLIRQLDAFEQTQVAMLTPSFAEARKELQKGTVYGIFYIPEDFEQLASTGRQPKLSYYTNGAYLIAGSLLFRDMKTISVLANASVGLQTGTAKGMTEEAIMGQLQPIVIDTHAIGNPWLNYSVYLNNTILPGILQLVIFMVTVFSIGSEIKQGTARRWLSMGHQSLWVSIVGKLLPHTVVFTLMGFLFCAVLNDGFHDICHVPDFVLSYNGDICFLIDCCVHRNKSPFHGIEKVNHNKEAQRTAAGAALREIHPSDGLPEIRSLPATVLSRSDCDCE